MKSGATLFLTAMLVLVGIGALAFLLVVPHFEGRNAQATAFEVYFNDPFLAYVYVAAIPFFVGLWHAIKVAGRIDPHERFSASTLKSLRAIKHCAIALIAFVAGAEVFILANQNDDRAGGVMMGLMVAAAAIAVAAASSYFIRQTGARRPMEIDDP